MLQLIGAGTVKQRLCDASLRHLCDVDAARLPPDVAERYQQLMDSLNTAPATGGLGRIGATVRKMSDQEAAACAAQVLDLYLALSAGSQREPVANPQRQLRLVGEDEAGPLLSRA
ncbi:MAG: hypothetical protein MUO39_09150 [Steroidobacteraceae bacterium]|nr:hypothetical protein [Steroidobacteraceae bacterium]